MKCDGFFRTTQNLWLWTKLVIYVPNFFLKILEDTSPFVGPLIPLFWTSGGRLLWVSRPEWVLPYSSLVEAYMLCYTFPEIHLWCDTCQSHGGQHGSQTISSTYMWGIGGTQNQELSCRHSQCEIRQARLSTDWAIPARLYPVSRLHFNGSNKDNQFKLPMSNTK